MSVTAIDSDNKVEVDQYSKSVPWYKEEVEEDINPSWRELLQNYSHVPPEEIDTHIHQIRDKAWFCSPYPCIGRFRFLELSISRQSCYPRILSFLKEPQSHHTLLDLGCCFAQDLRTLIHDGVPSENLYGCDMVQKFLDLSYDLFRDKDTMKGHLFTANVLEDGSELDKLEGQIDAVYAGSFFHLFGWDDQLIICKRIIKMSKPRKGSTVFGRQTGNLKGQEVPAAPRVGNDSKMIWRHDVESFRRLWDLAGQETGTKWNTWGVLDGEEGMGAGHWAEKGLRRLSFEVQRVE